MPKIFALLVTLILYTSVNGQGVAGAWTGTVTQDEGGYRTAYEFSLYLNQDGEHVNGRGIVKVDEIFAEMEVEGELHSGMFLELKDLRIVEDSTMQGMEWCLKKYQLILKQEEKLLKLEGFWQGAVSFGSCVPGKIYLKKENPRP